MEKISTRSTDEAFKEKIEGKFKFWFSLISDSDVSEETKTKLVEALSSFKEDGKKLRGNLLDLSFRDKIGHILLLTEKDKKKEAGKILFELLKTDLWDFFSEIRTKI
jgi:hypothetical protein